MSIALAYEMGNLTHNSLTRIQQWALSYYLIMRKRERGEELKILSELKQEVKKLTFVTNPKLVREIEERLEANDPAEESVPVKASELGDFESLLAGLDNEKNSTFGNLGEWV